MTGPWRARRGVLCALLLATSGCAGGAPPRAVAECCIPTSCARSAGAGAAAGARPHADASWIVPFRVRGRVDDPSSLRWGIGPGDGPLGIDALHDALLQAAGGWNEHDGVDLQPAAAGQAPDVVVSWQAPADDPCRLFGRDSSVAHTGPPGPSTFVHLDASRPWCLGQLGAAAGCERLDVALAHELGHVLGLDHTADEGALMSPDTHETVPAAADLAGLHSLYGGGADAPGDVCIERARDGRRTGTALRRVAPPELTALALFDTDGDGDEELLVWRTDPVGLGALMIHHFETAARHGVSEPRLARTLGPWLDVIPPGARTALRTGPDGRRWLLTSEADDLRVRAFDDGGQLRSPEVQELIALDTGELLSARGPAVIADRTTGPEARHATDGEPADVLSGDLDGDGEAERVRRRSGGPPTGS
jgi:hypothetical protein